MSGVEIALSLVECTSVSAGVVDASHVSSLHRGVVRLRENRSNSMMSAHQVWMIVVIKTHTLLGPLLNAALAPVLADGTAMRLTIKRGVHFISPGGAERCNGPENGF